MGNSGSNPKKEDALLMGYRLVLKVGRRIVYSRSYSSEAKAKAAGYRTRGWTGRIIRS